MLPALSAAVGNTPVLHLARFGRGLAVPLYAKLELRSPTGSGWDRVAGPILDGFSRGTTLVVPSTGNLAVSLAWAASTRGIHVHAVIPRASSLEFRQLLALYKAKVELTSSELGVAGARERARTIASELGATLFDPFSDPRALPGFQSLADELREAHRELGLSAIVCGIGSGLTAKALRTSLPEVPLIGVEPSESAAHSGLPRGPHKVHGIGVGFKSAHLEGVEGVRFTHVSMGEAWKAKRKVASDEGLFAGPTTGALLAAAVAEAPRANGPVLVLAMDSGERYFSQEALVP